MAAIHVLNGPNLNLLGGRETSVYGTQSLADIERLCAAAAERHRLGLEFRQSNLEGDLINWLHAAKTEAAGIVLNPGAYGHTSIALHDAIRAIGIPVVEVHLSNVFARETFRHHSYVSPVARGVICGFGAAGYVLAVDALAGILRESKAA